MGYFDYLDSKDKQEELNIALNEHSAKISFYVSLGVLGLFVLSVIIASFAHFGVSLWINVPNFLGIALGVVGIVFDQKTFKHFKKKRQSSPIANMALALNILWILMHVMMLVLNLAFLYY